MWQCSWHFLPPPPDDEKNRGLHFFIAFIAINAGRICFNSRRKKFQICHYLMNLWHFGKMRKKNFFLLQHAASGCLHSEPENVKSTGKVWESDHEEKKEQQRLENRRASRGLRWEKIRDSDVHASSRSSIKQRFFQLDDSSRNRENRFELRKQAWCGCNPCPKRD